MKIAVDMRITACPVCGIIYAMPKEYWDSARKMNDTCYCPNGHGWHEGYASIEDTGD